MKYEEISLGDKVLYHGDECVVIILNLEAKEIAIYNPNSNHNTNLLATWVVSGWCGATYEMIDNIEHYHGKHHIWVQPGCVSKIIQSKSESSIKDISGCVCSVCHIPSPYSEPNQPDNTFKCYSCRVQPLRAYY